MAAAPDLGSRWRRSSSGKVGARPSTLGRALAGRAPRIPRAAVACAVVAFLNAACWSLIAPPFEIFDEPDHFAYVQYLAETGHLPSSKGFSFAPAEEVALEDLNEEQIRTSPENHTISTPAEQRRLEHDLSLPLSRISPDAGFATSEPPLYYAVEAIPYALGSSGSILDRLALMRLFSALTAGITVLFVFLFLREALPGARWAWSVGSLGVAFSPLLGLMSGAINPDALLCAESAALFFCLARGFQRGLTPGLAALTGLTIALAAMTKLNFVGLVPGTVLGLVLITARTRRSSGRDAYRSLGLALAVASSPICLYVVVNLLSGRHADGTLASGIALTAAHGPIFREASYIWQFYLPRLPGMRDYFPGLLTTRQFWIDGFVGINELVYSVFPAWVDSLVLVPLALFGVLLGRMLFVNRDALLRRLSELSVYAGITGGLLVLVGANDYLEFPGGTGSYVQPRYMLPLIALYGVSISLAARGAGRRWGPVVGASIVVLAMAHDLFSQLLVISHFYG